MCTKMSSLYVLIFLLSYFDGVFLQGIGSGTNGNLRLCVVDGRGTFKKGNKYCPILEREKSGVECVLGVDRLDCLRRISKGSVDFGIFGPEDLVAAQWANVDLLVTNELRKRRRPFARSIVAVVNRRILPDETSSVASVLRNRSLCFPVPENDDIRAVSDIFSRYIETLIMPRSCDPNLSLEENRIKATAEFFGKSCKAGYWLPDKQRDQELKRQYSSLCAGCASRTCSINDLYWGSIGAFTCMEEQAGDVTWADLDDVLGYWKTPAIAQNFAILCRDGSWQPLLNNSEPCVWLQRPWPIVVAKRKVATAVVELTSSLTNSSLTVDGHWHEALAALLDTNQELPAPLQPSQSPMDYLSKPYGFREAYSQESCNPPRHITLCTTSLLENNKCEWLAEAGAVHGVAPPLQCARWNNTAECLRAVRDGQSDVTFANSDWLVAADRDYSLEAILHETTPIIENTNTVVAYVRKDAKITKMADLRGKKASFPRFDGFAFHSVVNYLKNQSKTGCKNIMNYFSDICAPGVEKYNMTEKTKDALTKNCYKEGGKVLEGELQALRALVEGKSDVAFVSMNTYNMYRARYIDEPWANNTLELAQVCPKESGSYCFIGWSNIGHMFTSKNLTAMRRHEIINVFTKLDHYFGKKRIGSLMFSMYGPFNHKMDVIFHNNTKALDTNDMYYSTRPFNTIPLNFERSLNDTCQIQDLAPSFATKMAPSAIIVLLFSIVLFS